MAFSNRMVIRSISSKQNVSYELHPKLVERRPANYAMRHLRPKQAHSTHSSLSTSTNSVLKSKFMQVYDSLKSDIFHDPSFEFDDVSRQWVDRYIFDEPYEELVKWFGADYLSDISDGCPKRKYMVDYNVPKGKGNRIWSLVDTYKLLKGEELTDDEMFLACALGWCAEWLHAYILITDDIIDDTDLRRGQPCWHRLPEVGLVAVNDALVLRNHTAVILKKYFKEKAYYVDLLELFNEIEYRSVSGQMIDMITTLGEKNLEKFSLSTNLRILQYKTSYGSFYLPVACALLMAGENLSDHVHVKDILLKMGIYFSVQDDYLDTYGDPKVTGKIGVDIENFKYSWMVAKALELANDEQKKILNENYGMKDPAKIAKVKEIYHTLNLQGVYKDYENKTQEELIKLIEANPSIAMQKALKSFLGKIYKRQK